MGGAGVAGGRERVAGQVAACELGCGATPSHDDGPVGLTDHLVEVARRQDDGRALVDR